MRIRPKEIGALFCLLVVSNRQKSGPISRPLFCLLVITVCPAKTAEPIEMLFGVCSLGGPRNHAFDGGQDFPQEGAVFVWRHDIPGHARRSIATMQP